MHDLQQLHGELHVADPAAAALDLGQLLAAAADVLLQAHLRAADLVDRAGLELHRVHERGHAVDELRAEPRVAGDAARLDHGLALPHGRVPLVVAEHGLERPAEEPGPAARPQRRIDAQRDALGGGLGQQRDQVGGGALRGRAVALVHEQQVDVARVVELGAAELAEADDAQAQVGGRLPDAPPPDTPPPPRRSRRRRSSSGAPSRSRAAIRSIARRRKRRSAAGAPIAETSLASSASRSLRARRSRSTRFASSSGCATRRSAAAVDSPSSRTSGAWSDSNRPPASETRRTATEASSGSGASSTAGSTTAAPYRRHGQDPAELTPA